ncbi:MAG: nucleotidyltransferase family protein [SAR324 cluster bacterium]|nr:nucleotidyltransferase family protein [SAR324 cluster bacterium]
MNKSVSEIKDELKGQLPLLSKQYRVKSMSLFGSYVKGHEKSKSDLDILVEYTEMPGLIKYIELENRLSDLLGIKVDLVIRDSLKPRIAENVLSEAIQI